MTLDISLLPVIDEFVALVTLPDPMRLDATGARPPIWIPDRLYAYPLRQRPQGWGPGGITEMGFTFRLAWCRAGQGEESGQLRLRAVSDQLDEGVKTLVDVARANQSGSTWEHLQVETIQYDAIVTFDSRAVFVDCTGYRLVS